MDKYWIIFYSKNSRRFSRKISLLLFNSFIVWWGRGEILPFGKTIGWGRDTYFWEDHWMGERPLCFLFPLSYHFLDHKHCFVADILVWSRSSYSLSFGLCCAFSYRETIEVLEGHSFRRGWSGSPLGLSVFLCCGGLRFLGKLSSLVGKFYTTVKRKKNRMDRLKRKMLSLVGPFLLHSL